MPQWGGEDRTGRTDEEGGRQGSLARGSLLASLQMRGTAMYDDSRNQFGLLEIIALAEYVNGNNAPQLFTTALRKVTSIDGWHRVPPKALSDYDDAYYSVSGSGNPNK